MKKKWKILIASDRTCFCLKKSYSDFFFNFELFLSYYPWQNKKGCKSVGRPRPTDLLYFINRGADAPITTSALRTTPIQYYLRGNNVHAPLPSQQLPVTVKDSLCYGLFTFYSVSHFFNIRTILYEQPASMLMLG